MNPLLRTLLAGLSATLVSIITLMSTTAPALGQDHVPSKVDIPWNRYSDYDEMTAHLKKLAAAYPKLMTLESVGKSVQGRDMWVVTINVESTGPASSKPAIWIDGNIHANEIQAMEVVLYSIWYLTKSYGEVDQLTELMDRTAF
ncbi:MAG: hypothetical protein KC983_10175, partial [Phycisphaerales bacterium]|nr:hypothetical protein [Phycisphaerales bacterium]